VTVPVFALDQSAPLWQNLPKPVSSNDPQPMEHFDQSYGYILYRTSVSGPQSGTLEFDELHDYAQVYRDGTLVGTIDRRLGQTSLPLATTAASSRLDILVENSGRINSQSIMRSEIKGITRQVRLDGRPLTGWQIFCLPFNSLDKIKYGRDSTPEPGPAFFKGHFEVKSTGDVFLDLDALGKGALWVNGHAIGRYWNLGPQRTLFVPGPWLRQGKNEVVVFDLLAKPAPTQPHLSGLAKPVLDAPTAEE
jgi:beta-galactosidase